MPEYIHMYLQTYMHAFNNTILTTNNQSCCLAFSKEGEGDWKGDAERRRDGVEEVQGDRGARPGQREAFFPDFEDAR